MNRVKIKSILYFLYFWCCTLLTNGQTLIVPEKRIYQAPDGHLYIQKSLPLYIHMDLGEANKSKGVLLQNLNDQPKGNPIYLKHEGLNLFHSPYAVDPATMKMVQPKMLVQFEVYADSRAPVSRVDYRKETTAMHSGKLYLLGKTEITLLAQDETSGVSKIYYSIDSADYKEYATPLTFDREKEYLLKYYAVDNVGNMEALKIAKFTLDKSAPVSTFETKGDRFEDVLSSRSSLVFSVHDNFSGVKSLVLKLDGKVLPRFSGVLAASGLSEGEHKIEYYAEDNVGNAEEPHVFEFYVDRTGPTILQDIIGKKFMSNGKEFSSGRSQLKLTALDNKAGVKAIYYSINKGEYQLYEKPVFLKAVKGRMEVKAYAVDKVNNKNMADDEENAALLPYVDLTGPVMKYSVSGPQFTMLDTLYVSNKTKVLLTGFDNECGLAGIQYIVDNKDTTTYTKPFTISDEGFHSVDYIGTDNVDNTSTQNFKVFVDNTGPKIFPVFSVASKGKQTDGSATLDVYPSHVGLFIAATDAASGFDHMTYSLNGAPEKLFNGYITGFSSKNLVVVKAYDKVGNESQVTLEFAVRK